MRRLQRTIEELGWSREVPRLADTARVASAFDLMRRVKHDCVLVTRGDELAGIFTSHDFLNRVAAVRGDLEQMTLAEVMTRRPYTLRPSDDVVFAINWMAVEDFRNVPIVDDRGRVLGVLTIWDVMRHLGEFFDEIDATPRQVAPTVDSSSSTSMIDLGGDQ
jgi:CBS domain-containing protein